MYGARAQGDFALIRDLSDVPGLVIGRPIGLVFGGQPPEIQTAVDEALFQLGFVTERSLVPLFDSGRLKGGQARHVSGFLYRDTPVPGAPRNVRQIRVCGDILGPQLFDAEWLRQADDTQIRMAMDGLWRWVLDARRQDDFVSLVSDPDDDPARDLNAFLLEAERRGLKDGVGQWLDLLMFALWNTPKLDEIHTIGGNDLSQLAMILRSIPREWAYDPNLDGVLGIITQYANRIIDSALTWQETELVDRLYHVFNLLDRLGPHVKDLFWYQRLTERLDPVFEMLERTGDRRHRKAGARI